MAIATALLGTVLGIAYLTPEAKGAYRPWSVYSDGMGHYKGTDGQGHLLSPTYNNAEDAKTTVNENKRNHAPIPSSNKESSQKWQPVNLYDGKSMFDPKDAKDVVPAIYEPLELPIPPVFVFFPQLPIVPVVSQ